MNCSDESILSSPALCNEILETLAAHCDRLFLGIDGLDECDESDRCKVLAAIDRTLKVSEQRRNVRVFLSSRKEKSIENLLSSTNRLELRARHLENDIRSYVQTRVLVLAQKFKLIPEHQKRLTEDTVLRAHGT